MEYIAHFKYSDNKIRTHSVFEHCKKVSEYCALSGESIGIPNMAKLAGIIHDMGKFSDGFQEYLNEAIKHSQNETYDIWRKDVEKVDHGIFGAMYIYNKYHNNGGFSKLTSEILAMVVCYHHGGLADCVEKDEKIPLLTRFEKDYCQAQNEKVISRFFQFVSEAEIDTLFQYACSEVETLFKKIKEFTKSEKTFWLHLLVKHLYSILIDSDRYDTFLFIEDKKEDTKPYIDLLWNQYIVKLDEQLQCFREMSTNSELEKTVKKVRLDISDDCYNFAKKPTGIYTLTVPTGGGKTFSSLRFALNHAKETNKKRIIYILPYTTIIEQNAQVVRDALDCGENLLEYHSNVLDDNTSENYKLLTARWDSPIIFTTMVQFLDTLYAKSTQSLRRMHNLADSIIIFDEIQSIPIKCISLFNSAVNYLSKICNSTIVLCSATQPTLEETKRPLLKEANSEIVSNVSEQFKLLKRMEVQNLLLDKGYTYEMVGDLVFKLKQKLSSILIILNTKSTAEKIYNELSSRNMNNEINIFFLSTNLCPAHRKKVIKSIKDCLDKNEPIICVSTQLIEAGVDISFDGVIRSLAGLDSIAQATGRGNRHGKSEVKSSYIIKIADENLTNLTEIKLGAIHCEEVLNAFKKNPDNFDNDLLSPKAIQEYYFKYYSDEVIKKQMCYPVIGLEPIYDMLKTIEVRSKNYSEKTGKQFDLTMNYLFKTARENFQVIEQLTKTVIVPHCEGRLIISELLNRSSLRDKMNALKKAQQYSVNIYDDLFRKLVDENALVPCEIEGIHILDKAFYDDVLGVIKDKKLEYLGT